MSGDALEKRQSCCKPLRTVFIYLENLVKPSVMPRPLALTGITTHTQKHFTSSDKTQKEKTILVASKY